MAFMKSKTKFQANRIAAFTLLVALSASCSLPAKAQDTGVAEYARHSREADKKAGRQYRKTMKKYAKAQRKAAKKANRQTRNPK
jgi:hypothetical protein